MNRVRLRPAARADLEAIWRSSVSRFGPQTAEAVVGRIDSAFALLLEFPLLGKARPDLAEGVRAHSVRGCPYICSIGPSQTG